MAYGPGTDLLGLAGVGIELQSVSTAPTGAEAQCADENGDILDAEVYGTYARVTCRYKVRSGVTVTVPSLGAAGGSYYLTKFGAKTSNNDQLEITAEGILSTLFEVAPKVYDISSAFGTLTGGKGAVLFGITLSAGKQISSSCEAQVNIAGPLLDATGAVVDMDIYGCRVTASNECQAATGVPAAAAAVGWTLEAGSGSETDDNVSYGTKTFTAFQHVVGAAAP